MIIILNKILHAFQKPFYIRGKRAATTISLGAAIFPDDAKKPKALLKYADMAMYRAKSNGKNCYAFFDESMNEQMNEHIRIEDELKQAIENDELFYTISLKLISYSGRYYGI